jgi:alpha-beta hydrolase superfamily lysophospholipase
MSTRHEGYFKGFDQTELFYQTWTPEKIRGTLLITHGLAEHSECYNHIAKPLAETGWQVLAWDLRGHGRSDGKRGFVLSLDSYLQDLHELFANVLLRKTISAKNLVMFGHSMGGLISIRYNQMHLPQISALCLSSPALGLSMKVPKIKEALARFAIKWLPTLTLHNEIKYEDLTRDAEMLKSHAGDALRHDKVSPGLFLSMLDNFALADQQVDRLSLPLLMQLSGDDRLVSTQASLDFFEKVPAKQKKVHVYSDSLHEIFNDRDRDQVLSDLEKFINPFLGD